MKNLNTPRNEYLREYLRVKTAFLIAPVEELMLITLVSTFDW